VGSGVRRRLRTRETMLRSIPKPPFFQGLLPRPGSPVAPRILTADCRPPVARLLHWSYAFATLLYFVIRTGRVANLIKK
jgi:hypothetical protein